MVDKLYKGNLVAILVSPDYGAGWSTWGKPEMAFDGEIAQAVLDKSSLRKLSKIATENWPNQYQGGLSNLMVHWIPQGTYFKIREYDGYETLELKEDDSWQIA